MVAAGCNLIAPTASHEGCVATLASSPDYVDGWGVISTGAKYEPGFVLAYAGRLGRTDGQALVTWSECEAGNPASRKWYAASGYPAALTVTGALGDVASTTEHVAVAPLHARATTTAGRLAPLFMTSSSRRA